MPALSYLKLTDKLACQGSVTTYGVLHPEDLESAADVRAVEDQESLTFSYSRVDQSGTVRAITAQLRAGRVITQVWDDGSFDEWRIGPVEDGRRGDGLIVVSCIPLVLDLVERAGSATGKGWVSEVSNGERVFDYEIAERTASSIFTDYVIANLPTWVTLGTVDPTAVIPAVSVTHLTPWELAVTTRDALRAMDVTCELALRRNGTTDYKLDLVTQIGSSAATPVFHPHVSLTTLRRKTDPTLQATRVLPLGATAPDTYPGVLGRSRWKGGAPSGLVIALTDRNGGASPIAFDNQWVNNYLLRIKTGRTFLITASNAAAGTVTLQTTVSTIAADEDFEFRLDEPLTNLQRARFYAPGASATKNVLPLVITVVASAVLTLIDDWASFDPVATDNQWVDWKAERSTFVMMTAYTVVTKITDLTGEVTCTSTAGINAGDYIFIGSFNAPDYTLLSFTPYCGVVDSLLTTPTRIAYHIRNSEGGPVQAFSTSAYLRVYRPVATKHRITASSAAGNTVTVDAAGTAAATDILEFYRDEGAGEIPCYIDHPTYIQADPTGYGVKVAEISRPGNLGITQLIPNSWMRTWSNGANPPDGWTKGGTGTFARDAVTTRFGGYSYKLTASAGGQCQVNTPVAFPSYDSGHRRLSVRAWVYFETYTGDIVTQLAVYPTTPAGLTEAAFSWPTLLGTVYIQPTNGTLSSAYTKVGTGYWVELKIEGMTLLSWQDFYSGLAGSIAPFGLLVRLEPCQQYVSGNVVAYLDTVEVYPFMKCPEASYEFGDATSLLQAGNKHLRDNATPPVFYDFGVRDLERAFPDEYGRLALSLGGNVRAPDTEYGVDATVRLLRRERDLLDPMNTKLTLANRPRLFTDLTQKGTAPKPVSEQSTVFIVSAAASPVLTVPAPPVQVSQITTATTLPSNSEIVVPATTAVVITTVENSSVTYQPANTATAPSTTIAPAVVGAAPVARPPSTGRRIQPF